MRRISQQDTIADGELDKFSGWRWPLCTADATTNCQWTLPYNSIGRTWNQGCCSTAGGTKTPSVNYVSVAVANSFGVGPSVIVGVNVVFVCAFL